MRLHLQPHRNIPKLFVITNIKLGPLTCRRLLHVGKEAARLKYGEKIVNNLQHLESHIFRDNGFENLKLKDSVIARMNNALLFQDTNHVLNPATDLKDDGWHEDYGGVHTAWMCTSVITVSNRIGTEYLVEENSYRNKNVSIRTFANRFYITHIGLTHRTPRSPYILSNDRLVLRWYMDTLPRNVTGIANWKAIEKLERVIL